MGLAPYYSPDLLSGFLLMRGGGQDSSRSSWSHGVAVLDAERPPTDHPGLRTEIDLLVGAGRSVEPGRWLGMVDELMDRVATSGRPLNRDMKVTIFGQDQRCSRPCGSGPAHAFCSRQVTDFVDAQIPRR
jgi:hypothetical protein